MPYLNGGTDCNSLPSALANGFLIPIGYTLYIYFFFSFKYKFEKYYRLRMHSLFQFIFFILLFLFSPKSMQEETIASRCRRTIRTHARNRRRHHGVRLGIRIENRGPSCRHQALDFIQSVAPSPALPWITTWVSSSISLPLFLFSLSVALLQHAFIFQSIVWWIIRHQPLSIQSTFLTIDRTRENTCQKCFSFVSLFLSFLNAMFSSASSSCTAHQWEGMCVRVNAFAHENMARIAQRNRIVGLGVTIL